jgi:hypothetical protein
MKFTILFIIIIFALFGGYVYMHELAHVQIYKSYGKNSSMHFGLTKAYVTTTDGCDSEECELAHNINESVGYHLQSIYFMIAIGFLVIIAQLEIMEWRNR